MGFWGADLYQNDTSLDVKNQFEERLRKGENVENITQNLKEEFLSAKDDLLERCAFWFALADTQWTWGVLLPDVKKYVLHLLEAGGDLKCWQDEPMVTQLQRKRVMLDLQYNLLSPQPPFRKPVKRRVYRCEWKLGDVYAYRLESELAREKGIWGRYFLIQKVDEGVWHPGHIVPIVYIKITQDGTLPATIEEYNKLEYVQTAFTKYEDRFCPIDGRRPKEDIQEKSKINYEVDEYGLLPHFRILLLNTSKKVIPQNLIYLGNYKNAIPPQKEFVPHTKINIRNVSWKLFDDTFETTMIQKYFGYNKRELAIYSTKNINVPEDSFTEIMLKVLEKR